MRIKLDLVLDESWYIHHVKRYIPWIPEQMPHVVIFGVTGSGKSFCGSLLLGRAALYTPDVITYLCDFKGDSDFSYLIGSKHFYRFKNCKLGLDEVCEILQNRQNGVDNSRNMVIFFFDEWASYCNSLDKREADEAKKKLSLLLMLGRSFHIHVVISQQRVDAAYFNSARDNFSIAIALGNLSEEGKSMIFQEYKPKMKPDRKRGTGYMLSNGSNFYSIIVPRITNLEKLHSCIKRSVNN
ncbi:MULTISPECIES: FtsK/SpoIIIE domain-containing protein [unclassified Lacrimispora]|uniref:FtsK/SpoIIIE domain-containing protein n=1 Tax=unclassified Lacrimispora TaxID=2719232 RepID=UPI00377025DC